MRPQDAATADPSRPDHGRRCVVHIGANKTGSTTIQDWLARNSAALAKQGVLYDTFEGKPLPALVHAIGFTTLGLDMIDSLIPNPDARLRHQVDSLSDQRAAVAEFAERAEASIARSDYQTYVISSEFLPAWLLRLGAAPKFHAWLEARFDLVHYVYYVRDQIDWVPSAYTQMVKMGGTMSFDAYIEKHGERNFCFTARVWRTETGATSMEVRPLERDFLKDGELIADFADVLGADPTFLAPPRTLNEAMSAEAVEKMRQLNIQANAAEAPWSYVEREAAINALVEADTGEKLRLSEHQAALVARRNEGANERLRKMFLPERKVLFQKAHEVLATSAADDAANR